jgi:hypothetical protein
VVDNKNFCVLSNAVLDELVSNNSHSGNVSTSTDKALDKLRKTSFFRSSSWKIIFFSRCLDVLSF